MPKASTTATASVAGETTTSSPRSSASRPGSARKKTTRDHSAKASKPAPKAKPRTFLFPPPVTFNGEEPKDWDALYAGIWDAVQPADGLDEFWAYNMACIAYDVFRYRNQRDVILFNLRHEGLEDLLAGLVPNEEIQKLSIQYRTRSLDECPEGGTSLRATLASVGVTQERITAATWLNRIDDVERIERMAMQAEARLIIMQRESHRRAEARMRLAEAIPRLLEAIPDERRRAGGADAASPGHETLEDGEDEFPHDKHSRDEQPHDGRSDV
jgi:hypothetical protein